MAAARTPSRRKRAIARAAVLKTAPERILAIDIGGTKLKILATGETEPRKTPSGDKLTPGDMVEKVKELGAGWKYDAVSIGYPGLVGEHGPISEPGNLGHGWVGFNFAAAFDCPVRICNDAAMQALGSYDGGRMLFLGFGTGLGSSLIAEKTIVLLELGRLMHRSGRSYGEVVGRAGLAKIGKRAWRAEVAELVTTLMAVFVADYVVIGGGNAKQLKELPPGARRGHNLTAFRGGFRLWNVHDVPTLDANGHPTEPVLDPETWRLL